MAPTPDPETAAGGGTGAALSAHDGTPTSASVRPSPGVAEIRAWLVREVAAALAVPETQIDPDAGFVALGLDSVVLFSLTGHLTEWLDRDLPASLLFEVASINELVVALAAPYPPAP